MDDKEIIEGLTQKRDELQGTLADARKQRVSFQLEAREKYRSFQQKIGEISFTFGAAIVPVILIAQAEGHKVAYLDFVLVGITLYLLTGFIALWRTKTFLERDAGDAPYIGLAEEIATYPLINAQNKLLVNLHNEQYQKEYFDASGAAINQLSGVTEPSRVDFTADVLTVFFVIATLFVARSVWPYEEWIYWVVFILLAGMMVILSLLSYGRAQKNGKKLQSKREELAGIRKAYQDWQDENIRMTKSKAQKGK